MSAGDTTGDYKSDDRVDDQLNEIEEALCDEFELEWKEERGRTVEDFLTAHHLTLATASARLIRELTKLYNYYRPFKPGDLLAERYRVQGIRGRGGMGVVYRAYDQVLRKSVALKFLHPHLAADPEWQEQFSGEVAAAQEVTHDCVARVHDIGKHEGQMFLSMEYIEGGDLASLLKFSSGLLAEETAAKYARQICRGLAAIHKRGLVHRDLKPQNIMIKEGGRVCITDFGLAGRVGSFTDAHAGTPLYQSPEQLNGTGVTARSDIYALGLVLYEMFTGRRAFEATTPADLTRAELIRLQKGGPPNPPSSYRANLHTEVNDIILKCLEFEPAKRPARANNVLHQLLRAGGTPTAEDISEAEAEDPGHKEALSSWTGLTLFGLTLACILLGAWLNDYAALFRQELKGLSPHVLCHEAREHLRALGYDSPARDFASGIATDERLLTDLRPGTPGASDAWAGRPPLMYFWYRESPDVLAQRLAPNDTSGWSMPGRVLPNEPPLRVPGMTCVFLDFEGNLLELHAVPPAGLGEPECKPDPQPLLTAAGFPDGSLQESKHLCRVPRVHADWRMAWEATQPNTSGVAVRVEAAFYRGQPVYFHVGPPDHPDRLPGFIPNNLKEQLAELKNTLLGLIALPIGGWFAWRNWRLRRANPRGASILAGCFVVLGMVGWTLAAHHAAWPNDHLAWFKDELSMFTGMLGRVLFDALLLWLAYLALEPWVRRTSWEFLISWNRLLLGKWSDPLVGRDVLVGVAAAAGFVATLLLLRAAPGWLGYTQDPKTVWDAAFTEGAGGLIITMQIALMVAWRNFFLFFLILLVCGGRMWLAAALNVAIWWGMYAVGGDYIIVGGLAGMAFALVSLFVLLRAGLLGFVAFHLAEQVLVYMPITTDFSESTWYRRVSILSLLLVGALAGWGFWAACRRSVDTMIRRV